MRRFLDGLWRFAGFLLSAYAGLLMVGRASLYVARELSLSIGIGGVVTTAGHVLGLVLGGWAGLWLLRDREPSERP